MRSRLALLFGLVAALAAVDPALAQRTTGDIIGNVKDESGAAMPGVTVALKGDKIVGVKSTVTNAQGLYRFAALPPGEYALTFTMSGFATVNKTEVGVSLGGTSQHDVSLKVSQMAEAIDVTGDAPVVDTSSTALGTTYDRDWVQNAPIRRFTFFDLINAAPGVSQNTSTSSRSTSLGSATDENSYQLDGTDFTAPFTGAAWPWPNTDAIEEIEVISLGAPAEYGNLQGAVFNVVTRQGGNDFHFDANVYFQNQGLTSSNTTNLKLPNGRFADLCPGSTTERCPYNRDKYFDTTIQAAGPILKDKLWFFASFQHQDDFDSQPGTLPQFPAKFGANRVFGKLNWQINQNNKLQFAYHDDYYRIPARATAVTAPSTIVVETGHNPSPNLTWTSVVSDKTYFEARASGFYGTDHGDPLDGGSRVQPRFFDLDSGLITGGVYSWYDGTSSKTAISGKVSHFADNFLGGTHDFKFGVQYNLGGHNYVIGYNDYIYTYSGVPAYGYTQLPSRSGGKMKNLGIFADDTFRVNPRLTLNLGLRFDNSVAGFQEFELLDRLGKSTGQSTAEVSNLYTWRNVSPRAGFAYKLTEDGRTAFKAHYGRYYSGIVTGEYASVSPSITPRFLFFGEYDGAGNPIDTELVSDNKSLSVDPNFKAPYTDQFVAAFERELGKNVGLTLNYTYKNGQRYGGWIDTGGIYTQVPFLDNVGAEPTGQTINVFRLQNSQSDRRFQLTNRDGMSSKTHAGIIQVTKRMSSNWQMVASAVFTKSDGRLSSSLNSPIAGQSAHGGGSFGQNPNDLINSDGALIGERPFQGKLQLVYQLPKGFLLGANFLHQSGRPWGRQVSVTRTTGIPTTILTEKLGERRVGTWNNLDVRLQREFVFSGDNNVAFFVDALNVLNDNANENIASRLATSSSFGVPTRFIFPRRIMLGAKVRF